MTNPLVDPIWYRTTYAHLGGKDPATHYHEHGWRLRHDPNPLFDTDWYLARYPDVRESGDDPLDHYLRHGAIEGRDPSPWFDSDWYLSQYADVREAGRNPLLHYLAYGQYEGRLPKRFVGSDQPKPSSGIRRPGRLRRRLGSLVRGRRARRSTRALVRRPVIDSAERSVIVSVLNSGVLPTDAVVAVAWATADDLATVQPLATRSFPDNRLDQLPALISATAAVGHLEWLRHDGVTHLYIPAGAAIWLSQLPEFRRHLERYRRMDQIGGAVLYDIRKLPAAADHTAAFQLQLLVAEYRDETLRDPATLDLWTGFDFMDVASPGRVFQPPDGVEPPFPYADASVDFVAVATGDPDLEMEARRIAGRAVFLMAAEQAGSGIRLDVQRVPAPDVSAPSVSIVIPTHNGVELVRRCLASLDETVAAGTPLEILVVDDGSAPVTNALLAAEVAQYGRARLVRTHANLGYVGAVNIGARAASGQLLVLLNDDTITLPGWLSALVRTFRQYPDAGAVGGKLLYPDGRLQEAGGIIFADGSSANVGRDTSNPDAPQYNYVRDVDYVSGALLATRAHLFHSLGGLDPIYGFGYYDDSDYAFRMRQKGYRTYYQPESVIVHIEGATSGSDIAVGPKRQQVANREIFNNRWKDKLARQPARPAATSGDVLAAIADRTGRPGAAAVGSGAVLVIDQRVPAIDMNAGDVNILDYVRILVDAGFKVIYKPNDGLADQPDRRALEQMGVELQLDRAEFESWLRNRRDTIEAVLLARPTVAVDLLPTLLRSGANRVVYHVVDLHHLRERRRYETTGDGLALKESRRLLDVEASIFRQVDAVLTPSAAEAPIIKRSAPRVDVHVVPAYVCHPSSAPIKLGGRDRLIFVGGFAHPPNGDAADYLVHEIMPRVWREEPDATLMIVGSQPTAEVLRLASERVHVTGYVPDLAPYFARSRVSINPLRFGAGVKGKIVASLEAGVPVVTTTIGAEGIDLKSGVNAFISDDADEMATYAVRLLRDDDLALSISAAGQALCADQFGEERVRQALLATLGLTRSARRRSPADRS